METKILKKERRYKSYNQEVEIQIPMLLSEAVKGNVLLQIINKVVDKIDLSALDVYYSGKGCPPYHPRMMLKVWIYGFCSSVYTSRLLAKKLREDLGFIYLSGNQRPCFKTLSCFRSNRMKGMIDVVFKEVLSYLLSEGYIDLSDLYIDGSKWEANANKHQIIWRKNTERYRLAVEARITALLKEVDNLQVEEDANYGSRDLNEHQDEQTIQLSLSSEHLNTRLTNLAAEVVKESDKKRKQQLKRLEKSLSKEVVKIEKYEEQEKIMAGRNSYSKTDEDATAMRMKDELLKPGYNVQISTSNQYIVNLSLHANASDSPTLIPHLAKMEERLIGLVGSQQSVDLTADAGYGSEENYEFIESNKHLTGYIKYPLWYQEHSGALAKKLYRRENWDYDKETDQFTCPNKQPLTYIQEKEQITQNGYSRLIRIYEAKSCKGCPFFLDCRGDKALPDSNRKLYISRKLEAHKERVKNLLGSKQGKEKRSQRAVDVETPFGDIKYNRGHRRFILRGMDKVYIESSLLSIAHNLIKAECQQTGKWAKYYAQRQARSDAKKRKKEKNKRKKRA